jgi:DNA-binding SARP family transcriptional activator
VNRFGVLGPVEVLRDGAPVPLGGPRPRGVLARLIVARGRVVPVGTLVADLWPADPPDGAVAAIRTFVAGLRRALEPDRAPRQPPRVLVTAGPGYALRAEPHAVDSWRFESRVEATSAPAETVAALTEALGWWRGPAYAEYADQPWARADIDRLDELRRLAVSRRAEALLALGRPLEAVADLRAQAAADPLGEDGWRLLALALYRAGRQGEALAALRSARGTLVAELGVDPGPELRRLEADILAQAPHLDPPAPSAPAFPPRAPAAPAPSAPAFPPRTPSAPSAPPFFGRDDELAALVRAAGDVARHGRPRLALLSGDAGSGKTALAEALTRHLAATGWSTAWGRNPEFEGAPAAWPFRQIAESLPGPDAVPVADDPATARFRLRQATVAHLASVAARSPVLLVVDDLHRADDGTLDLIAALTGGDLTAPVLLVGTYRATEIGPDLTAALARYARAEPVRVHLGALDEAATAALVRDIAPADDAAAAEVHRRSGGNPFFARELARLLATDGAAALARVPAGVRDVIRHRLAQLPGATQTVLRQAAVAGRDVDPDVLAALAGPDAALDGVDHGLRAGFLTERAGRVRFTHILVRDTLYRDLSAPRRARWHAAAGAAVEALHPDDVATLAYHFTSAADRATAPRAARYARAAAARAEARSDLHEAARLWRLAVDADDRAGTDLADRLPAVMGLGRALAVTGRLGEARRLRADAVTTAEKLGDPLVTARVITAFDVPAIWPRNDDEALSRQIAEAAERTLATLPGGHPELRSRLLSTLALELRGTTAGRGRRAAEEAEAIARGTGDPGLLAFALNARFMHTFDRTGRSAERARIGAELVALATGHSLITFEVLGRLVLLQSHSARGDLAAADREAAALDSLAARFDLPVVGVFTLWYAALRATLTAIPRSGAPTGAEPPTGADVEALYRAAGAALDRRDMPGMAEGLLPLALLSVRGTPDGLDGWGPYEPWVRPLIRLAAGDHAAARSALHDLPESPHDLLREARLCLAARAALAVGDHATMARVHADLLPARGELAGAASGALSFGPVAEHVDALAAALAVTPPA